MCGGTATDRNSDMPGMGLSPRVRGNPEEVGILKVHLRSIPACAGEPRCRKHTYANAEVYPRVCGGTNPVIQFQ